MVVNENVNFRLIAMAVNSVSSIIKTVQPPPNDTNETDQNKNRVKTFNFMDSFKPVYFVLRLLGLKPFSITHDSDGEPKRPKITILDGIWLAISLSVYAFMAYSVEGNEHKKLSAVSFMYILGYIFTMFGLFCSVATIVIDICNRFKFVDILRKITIFDNEVRFQRFVLLNVSIHCISSLSMSDGSSGSAFQLWKDMQTQLAVWHTTNRHIVRNNVDFD